MTARSKIDPPAGVRSLEIAVRGYANLPHAEAALKRQLERMIVVDKTKAES